jgi:hypothetical protein
MLEGSFVADTSLNEFSKELRAHVERKLNEKDNCDHSFI